MMTISTVEFEKELTVLLNRFSIDTKCQTPDFLLAEFLVRNINLYALVIDERERWFGRTPSEGPQPLEQPKEGSRLAELEKEIGYIDSILAHRDALAGKTRSEAIIYLIQIAQKAQPKG